MLNSHQRTARECRVTVAPPSRLSAFPTSRNSLNALRLLLATSVIVSHSWPIGGYGDDPRWGPTSLGQFAVAGFFAISGWLITRSRLSSELPSYAWRRFLRIYPGFFVALLVVAFVVAPLGSALGGGEYSIGAALRHVAQNAFLYMNDFSVGGGPTSVPYPGRVGRPVVDVVLRGPLLCRRGPAGDGRGAAPIESIPLRGLAPAHSLVDG